MANIKVSELSSATAFSDDDLAMIVQNGENKKITKANMLSSLTNKNFLYYTIPAVSGSLSTNTWQLMGTSVESDVLPAGIYVIIYAANISSAQTGFATLASVFDGGDSIYERSTIPVGNNLLTSTQIINTATLYSDSTHRFNMQLYSNVPITVSSMRVKLFKIN